MISRRRFRAPPRRRPAIGLVVAALLAAGALSLPASPATAATDVVDEIHANFGDNPGTEMWIYWHGSATAVSYGPTTAYGASVAPEANPVTQVDIAGPIQRAHVTGLTADTIYHYQIDGGADHQFKTAPTDDFSWDDIGDTATTLNTFNAATGTGCDKPWLADVWQGIAADNPDFVTHGGDISYANECGVGAVHQFYNDIAPIATMRAWQQTWGNHEYGPTNGNSPPGTPRDSMANYKSRTYLANPQTVPNDTSAQVSNPGCPSTTPMVNGCLGQDWGWFVVGHVLFITEPEPWVNAQTDWGPRAGALMAAAQADPAISYIVTTGHRPAYTSVNSQSDPPLRSVIDGLGDKYSPAARSDGKYVLNLAHHVHGGEVFAAQHGVVHVTNGGGGTNQIVSGAASAVGSLFRTSHFEHLRISVTAAAMRVDMICGPVFPAAPDRDACTPGAVVYTTTIPAPGTTPPTAIQWVRNPGFDGGSQSGWTGAFNARSRTSVQADATGNYRARVATTSATAQPAGLANANPFWVTGTVAGTAYSATAQAQPSVSGQKVVVLLREVTPAGTSVGSLASAPTTLTNTTGLTQLPTVTYTARNAGDTLKYSVYVTNLSGAQVLYVDNLSLTSPG